ncbi:MAG: hypothetical protein KW793_01965 [Candidatus Doudnabacteria bacterium]|nr:hypothetical protein [Candidatus Doudnabacteria bacterium]
MSNQIMPASRIEPAQNLLLKIGTASYLKPNQIVPIIPIQKKILIHLDRYRLTTGCLIKNFFTNQTIIDNAISPEKM